MQPVHRRGCIGAPACTATERSTNSTGHADIVCEPIDGSAGADHDEFGAEQEWNRYVQRIQDAADHFKPGHVDPDRETG
jgi:hypothetical protein